MPTELEDPHAVRALIEDAIAKDPTALDELVAVTTPVMRARAGRVLVRRGHRSVIDVEDLVQDAFAHLFADGGHALRAWDPARGLPFLAYVGLLAERAARMALRARKRDPWFEAATEPDSLSRLCQASVADARLEARDELRRLLATAEQRLTVTGSRYLRWLVLEDRSVGAIAIQTGSTAEAIYTWRARIKRLLLEIRTELHAKPA